MVMDALGHVPGGATMILCNNNSAINLSEDPLLHFRVKHVNIKYHFLREHVTSGKITMCYVNVKDNIADMFTKGLATLQFTQL